MQYVVGGHRLEIDCDKETLKSLLPSFTPFEAEESGADVLFRLTVDNGLKRIPESRCHLIREVDTGNGITRVDRLTDGGYQFLVSDIFGHQCGLLIASPQFDDCRVALRGGLGTQRFALNNALMLTYAFSAARHDTLLIHASVVRYQGRAYAFTAKSGTGKSTQVANWMRYIEGCDIVNDDNPIIRIVDGKAILYGSPWSGKTPCYRNIQVELGAVVLIERDDHNHVEPQRPIQAFSTLLTACSSMKWDETLYQMVCETCTKFVESIKVATLHCLPDRESALVCKDALI